MPAGKLFEMYRERFPVDEEDDVGRGKIVDGLPGYGTWRRVPGWPGILASSTGHIMNAGRNTVRKEKQKKNTGYMAVTVHGQVHAQVHVLVCRAFHGPAKLDEIRVIHKRGHKTEFERRGDNAADNLEWATASKQVNERKTTKPQNDSKPCVIWKFGDGNSTPVPFSSVRAAAQELNASAWMLINVLNGQRYYAKGKDKIKYAGAWVEAPDPDLDGEKWRDASEQSRYSVPPGRLFVSNRGRIQTKVANCNRWNRKELRMPVEHKTYAVVKICQKQCQVNVLVGELFFLGPLPPHFNFWRHKNNLSHDNRIENLMPVYAGVRVMLLPQSASLETHHA